MRTNENRGECSPLAALAGAILLVLANRSTAAGGRSDVQQSEVFVSGTHGYHTYRIPALVVTAKGTLLASCEGRKTSRSDTGDIDTLLRRSTDGGKTWSAIRVVSDFGGEAAHAWVSRFCQSMPEMQARARWQSPSHAKRGNKTNRRNGTAHYVSFHFWSLSPNRICSRALPQARAPMAMPSPVQCTPSPPMYVRRFWGPAS
jgi:hypothetical protein